MTTSRIGDELPRLVIGPLTRQDIVQYAGAACDFSPLHYDQPFVEAAGLPTVVVMGMFTAGMAVALYHGFRRCGPGARLQGAVRGADLSGRYHHLHRAK